MKTRRTKPDTALVLFVVALLGGCDVRPSTQFVDAAPAVIPLPASIVRHAGAFVVADDTPLVVSPANDDTHRIARYLAEHVAQTRGIALAPRDATASDDAHGAIALALDPNAAESDPEGYTLDVGSDGVRIAARTPRGLFYGAVTLWQLLSPDDRHGEAVTLAAISIRDHPRFRWRGLMLDVARHYAPPEQIERLLDQMALAKLNTLHWHLTDDQGWRLQIEAHPRLTEVGAWRVPAGAAYTVDLDPATGAARRYGGYYTHDEVRAIVRYAAERHIEIVPEIDMPGHAQAAIAAYPELGVTGKQPPVSSDWGVHTYLYNVEESTFAFLDGVIDEVAQLFPGEYLHIGGDEAAKDQWQASPRVQQRMRELGVADETALQLYFVRRVERMLTARGKRLIGWDEILDPGLPPTATVMSWRGVQGAVTAARAGHDVVMAPSPALYFDHLQTALPDEPPGRPTPISLADIYAYEPVPVELDAETATRVLGAQGNLWTEHMRTWPRVEHAAFPRAAALAERLWSPRGSRDFSDFLDRLVPQLARYRRSGIGYADQSFAAQLSLAPVDGDDERVVASLANTVGYGELRYTLDGREPGPDSPRYTEPLTLRPPLTLRARTFSAAGAPLAATRARAIPRDWTASRRADELEPCKRELLLRLEDDAPLTGERPVYNVDILDACWIWRAAPLADKTRIAATVGQLPYNFQLWHDTAKIVTRPPATPDGELVVRLDACDGPVVATLPLAAAAANPERSRIEAALVAQLGTHDLCFTFTGDDPDPLWVIDSVRLEPATH